MEQDWDAILRRHISLVGTPVTSEEVDTYERLSRLQAKAAGERGDRILRLVYGITLLFLLSVQILAVCVFTFLIGFGHMHIDRWISTTFVGGTLGEVSGLAFLVVRYLSPSSGGNDSE